MIEKLEKTRENKELIEYKKKRRVCVAPMLDYSNDENNYKIIISLQI